MGAAPKIFFDRVNARVRPRRSARLSAITSGGTIPEAGNYDVVIESEGRKIGDVEEDFAQESSRGDVFSLGSMPWQIQRISRGRLMVEPAPGMAPTLPFWHDRGGRPLAGAVGGDMRPAPRNLESPRAQRVGRRLADERMRDVGACGDAGGRLRPARRRGARRDSRREDRRGRALLRRPRRHANRHPHAVRDSPQSRTRPRDSKAPVPVVRFRNPGVRDRRRRAARAEFAPQLSARDAVQHGEGAQRARRAGAGVAGGADVRGALPPRRDARARGDAIVARQESSGLDSTPALAGTSVGDFSRAASMLREPARRDRTAGSFCDRRNDSRMPRGIDRPAAHGSSCSKESRAARFAPSRSTRSRRRSLRIACCSRGTTRSSTTASAPIAARAPSR